MLAEFAEWWGGQLLEVVPPRFRGAGTLPDALIADAGTPGQLTLLRRRGGAETRVGEARLDEMGTARLRAALADRPRTELFLVRLAAHDALERPVALPIAAERDPEQVLTYELERLTPFTAAEVFWGYTIASRDRARGRLHLHLTLIPRARVQPLLDYLAGLGSRPALLEISSPLGLRSIRLTHADGAGAHRRTVKIAGALAAGLFAAIVISPFLRQSLELGATSSELDSLAPRMREVELLRKRINGAGAGSDAIAAETHRLGDMLEALAAVTDILPDDTYLTEFTMRERKMTLSGLSASAPKLISDLSDDGRVNNPSFTAPVTRSENGHADVFSIRAELAD